MNYVKMLDDISDKVVNGDFQHSNWIIIGDNASGKSELLRNLIKWKKQQVYYIDSVNRYYKVLETETKLSKVNLQYQISSKEIVERRIEDDTFNFTDTFGKTEHIWRLYPLYCDRLHTFMNKFLKVDFCISRKKLQKEFGETLPMTFIDGKKVELSSGYQALVRIFSEIIFYYEILGDRGSIIIDEIDEFLSTRHAARILKFLIEEFREVNFIVSSHSSDLIANSKDCNIVVLNKNNYNILDSNDFQSLTDVNSLFAKLFEMESEEEFANIDNELQRLLNLKIAGNWDRLEEEALQRIEHEKLSNVQRLIYRQIKDW